MAQNEFTFRRMRCVYVGLEVRPGKFERDESKWNVNFEKSKAEVTFEWPNVFDRDGETYRSSVNVTSVSRNVPNNPLSTGSACRWTARLITENLPSASRKALSERLRGLA